MPLRSSPDPIQQLVTVTAEGEVTRADVEAYLSEVDRLNARSWRKLVDLRNSQGILTGEDVELIGWTFREAAKSSDVGALAVVMPSSEPERVMRLLGFLAAAKRPMRLFKTMAPAQRWIESVHAKPTASGPVT
jgi:hypothetical protein